MTTAITPTAQLLPEEIAKVLVGGDLGKLLPEQRVAYYNAVCRSLGLNPLTKPFAYITLNGKMVLYALKDCTEQLRNLYSISLTLASREVIDGVYVVSASATRPDGRRDEATGAVAVENLKGEPKANAMMKAETKAKRRVTLSICGLGILDESEVDSIPDARRMDTEGIDTGGHPIGTQAASDAVRDRKLAEIRAAAPAARDVTVESRAAGSTNGSIPISAPAETTPDVPVALRAIFENLHKPGYVREAMQKMKDRMVELMPDTGADSYGGILEARGIRPGAGNSRGLIKAALLEMYHLCKFAEKQKAEAMPFKATDDDLPAGLFPEKEHSNA